MNIITAIGNEKLNILLRKEDNINVIGFDIQYQEGIFEVLEKNESIDYLILNINLIGELNYEELIEKIKEKNKNINFIIFLEKEDEKLKNHLIKNNIKFIFNKNDFNLENIINIFNNKNINLINENNNLKNNYKTNKNFIFKFKILIKNIIINLFRIKNNQNKKIINKIKLIINLKNKLIKNDNSKIISSNNNFKINIMLEIKINNKKNKNILNKKIKLIKYENKILNREDFKDKITKIIEEEI